MSKKWNRIRYFFCFLLACQMFFLPGECVSAAGNRTYTVTFRAGNAGTFAEEDTEGICDRENVEYTANYIKITVAKGETLAEATGDLWKDDDALNAWCGENISIDNSKGRVYAYKPFDEKESVTNTPVNRNTEYVADYARVIEENDKSMTVTKNDEKWWNVILRYLPFSTR